MPCTAQGSIQDIYIGKSLDLWGLIWGLFFVFFAFFSEENLTINLGGKEMRKGIPICSQYRYNKHFPYRSRNVQRCFDISQPNQNIQWDTGQLPGHKDPLCAGGHCTSKQSISQFALREVPPDWCREPEQRSPSFSGKEARCGVCRYQRIHTPLHISCSSTVLGI